MKKRLPFLLFAVLLLQIPVDSNAWPKPDKVKKNLVGTWKFKDFLNNDAMENNIFPSKDPDMLYKAYTFKEDGKCVIWSLDKSKFDFPTQTVSYAVTIRKDQDGVEYAAIAFAESDIAPADIEKKLIGTYYCVVATYKDLLCWIKTDRVQKTWKKELFTRFDRITDQPKD